MICGQRQFILVFKPALTTIIEILFLVVLGVVKLFTVFIPSPEVIFVKNNAVPICRMGLQVLGFDPADFSFPQHVLERREPYARTIGVTILKLQFGIFGNELPAFEVNVAHEVFFPFALNSGLKGQYQNLLPAHLLCQLITGKGFTKAHFCVPEKMGRFTASLIGVLFEIFLSQSNGPFLFRTHFEGVTFIFRIGLPAFYCQDRCLDFLYRTLKPLALQPFNLHGFQNSMNVVIHKKCAIITDRKFVQ